MCNERKEEFCVHWLILIKSSAVISEDLILAIRYRDTSSELWALAARAGLEINKLICVLWRHSIIISNLKLRKLMRWRLKETLISFKFILWFKFLSSIWTCRILASQIKLPLKTLQTCEFLYFGYFYSRNCNSIYPFGPWMTCLWSMDWDFLDTKLFLLLTTQILCVPCHSGAVLT